MLTENKQINKVNDTGFEDFRILLKENSKIKLYIIKSLLITHDKSELNRNVYSFYLELVDLLF